MGIYLFLQEGEKIYSTRAENGDEAALKYGKEYAIKTDSFNRYVYDCTLDGFCPYFDIKSIEWEEDGEGIENVETLSDDELREKLSMFFEGFKDTQERLFQYIKQAGWMEAPFEFTDEELFCIWQQLENGYGLKTMRFITQNDELDMSDYEVVCLCLNYPMEEIF